MNWQTRITRTRSPRPVRSAPPFFLQLPVLFIVFLFFAAGDLFELHGIEFASGKYETYREIFLSSARGMSGRQLPADLVRPIVFALFYLPALMICLRRRDWPALGFGMAALHALALAVLRASFPDLIPQALVDGAFGAALPISFAWLVLRAKLWSWSYGALLLMTYPFAVAISPADGDVLRTQVLPFISLHLSFALLLFLTRTIWLIVVENLYVVRQLGFVDFLRVVGRTLQKWTPVLLFAVPYFALSYAIDREIRLTAYNEPLMREQLEPEVAAGDAIEWRDVEDRDLERDTVEAIKAHFTLKTAEWRGLVDEYRQELTRRNPKKFSYFVGDSYDRVFTPGLGLEPPEHSGFWSFVTEPATSAVQSSVEEAYDRKHRKTRKNLVLEADKVEQELEEGQKMGLDQLDVFEKQGVDAIADARDATIASVLGGFFVSRTFEQLTFLLFCVLCVRSLFYVFARVACARDAGTFVTLGDPEQPPPASPGGRIAARGARLDLPMQPGETFYVARRFQPHGKAPRIALPQADAAPLPRLRNGCYSMNAFTHSGDRAPVQITATRGAEFVEWRLAEGETVIFAYRNFVGMSHGVRLSALISARVTSQVFGRLIFPTATGPGTLVLMTEGAPHVGTSADQTFSMPPSRLVAWPQEARFHIDSELGLLDIYLSEAYVEPQAQASLIMDVDRQDAFGTGLARFVRRFLLPL